MPDSKIKGVMIKKLIRHPDERGFFQELIRKSDSSGLMSEFFKEGFAQLSMSRMHTGIIKAWHRHQKQVDWWFVPHGNIKAVLVALPDKAENPYAYEPTIEEFLMGEDYEPIILRIPPGVYHGCKVLSGPADLIYVTSNEYDGTDEERKPQEDRHGSTFGYKW